MWRAGVLPVTPYSVMPRILDENHTVGAQGTTEFPPTTTYSIARDLHATAKIQDIQAQSYPLPGSSHVPDVPPPGAQEPPNPKLVAYLQSSGSKNEWHT